MKHRTKTTSEAFLRSRPATVSAETRWPCPRVSSAASFRVDFVVQRSGDIGWPRSSG